MIRLLTIILMIHIGAGLSAAPAPNGVRCALSIQQFDEEVRRDRLLWTDTADFLKDRIVTGFAAGLSMDINITAFDSVAARFMVHAYTFAPQPKHGARNFNAEYGLPGRIGDLTGKNGARLTLTVTPLQPVVIDTAWCPYSHHEVKDFAVDPTAHMNIYYVERTLADYYWNSIKGMLENEYDNIDRILSFSMPGKYLLFLCPCKVNTVIWDDRFAMMIDPVRSTIFAIYTKEGNSVFPFLITQAAMYRNYGYTPAFLADGFANYTSMAVYDARKMKRENRLIRLDSLLDTYAYFQADPMTADRMSGAFVRYLVDRYEVGSFLELYRRADDLNLRTTIASVYGKSVDALEAEWLTWLDTVSISFEQFAYHADLAETRFDYATAQVYGREMLARARTFRDSLVASNGLSRASFFTGDYTAAAASQIGVIKMIDSLPGEWVQLAGYHLMNGDYDSAAAALDRAGSLDSTNSLVTFNKGLQRLCVGDSAAARKFFQQVVTSNGPTGGLLESRTMLGNLLFRSPDAADRAEALNQYNAVIGALARQDNRHNPSASQLMWLGIAYLGVGDTGNAEEFLQTAMFLETRTFYHGMINLWLGKVADVRGERAVARDYYAKVLDGASARYHQEEARLLLERPYRR